MIEKDFVRKGWGLVSGVMVAGRQREGYSKKRNSSSNLKKLPEVSYV